MKKILNKSTAETQKYKYQSSQPDAIRQTLPQPNKKGYELFDALDNKLERWSGENV